MGTEFVDNLKGILNEYLIIGLSCLEEFNNYCDNCNNKQDMYNTPGTIGKKSIAQTIIKITATM